MKTRYLPNPDDRYSGHLIRPVESSEVGDDLCIGRERELELIRIALGLDDQWREAGAGGLNEPGCPRIRLEGAPGSGKRALVEEVSRRVALPLYEIAGHAGMSPEDLVMAVVPRPSGPAEPGMSLVLQASPLTTALLWGGVAYFNGMHRVSEKALSPLVSLLDGRMELYSGVTGLWLKPRLDAAPFYLFCSWDPSESYALPAFIDQRTLPTVAVGPLAVSYTKKLVGTLSPPDKDQLFETAQEQKRSLLSSELSEAVQAFKETIWATRIQLAMQSARSGRFDETLRLLIAVGNLLPEKRASLQRFRDAVAADLRNQAYLLAADNNSQSAAKASPMYKLLFEAGYSERFDRNNFAHSLLHEGKLDQAMREILKAQQEPDAPPVAWITRGEIVEAQGNIPEAIECYKRAIELPPQPVTGDETTHPIAERYVARLSQKAKQRATGNEQ